MIKLFKKNPGILSKRVVVRPHVSWRFRLLFFLVVCTIALLFSWGMYEAGRRSVGVMGAPSSLSKLGETYNMGTCSQKKREVLCTQLAELTRQLQIVQTTNDDLAQQTRILGIENHRLKEELDFFEHVLAGNTKIDSGISIHQFSLKKGTKPGVYRYSVSLVQGGQRPKDFNGNLKFFVNLKKDDQRKTVLLTNKEKDEDFSINFKFYHRIEESFRVSPDTTVESLKVNVYEENDDQVKLTQVVEPSL